MSELPNGPFLTEAMDERGGGIDFLGMRQVNLAILQSELIPGLNNATADFGAFCLAAWIAWKFRQLCEPDNGASFTEDEWRTFNETVLVAIAVTSRDGSRSDEEFGTPARRFG